MAGRGGARAHVVYPLVDLPSLEHPQWLNEAGREIDVDPSSSTAQQSGPHYGPAETDKADVATAVDGDEAVEQEEDVEMEIDAEAEEANIEDEEAVDEELLSIADCSILHYSLLQTRQRHMAQLLPHIFSHPPIPSHARPRARAPPKSQFLFPTPPPPVQPLPYPEYHGPKPPEKPKDKAGSKEAPPSAPSTPKPGDDDGMSSETKDQATSSRGDEDNASPAEIEAKGAEATDTPAPKTARQRKNKPAAAAEEDAPAHETECIARVTLSVGPISYPETELWVGRFVEPRSSGPRHSRPRGERGSEARGSGSGGRPKGTGGPGRRSLALDATLRRAKMTLESGPNGPPRPGYMPPPTPGMPARPYRPPGPGMGMPGRPPGPGNYPQRPFPAPPVGFGPLPNAPPAGARQNIPPALIQRVNAAAARHPWLSVIIHKAARSSASKDELAKLGRIVARLNRGEDVGEGPEEGLTAPTGASPAPAGPSVRPTPSGPNPGPTPPSNGPAVSTAQIDRDKPNPPPVPQSTAPSTPQSSTTPSSTDVKPVVQHADGSTATSAPKPAITQPAAADSDSDLSDDEDFMHGPPQVGGGPGPEPQSSEDGGLAVPVPASPDSSLSSAPPSPEVAAAPLPPAKPVNGSTPANQVPGGPAAGPAPVRPPTMPALVTPAAGPGGQAAPSAPAFRPHAPTWTPRPVGRPPSGSHFTTPFPQTPSLGPRPQSVPYGRPPGRPPYNPANPPPHPILGPGRPYSYGALPQTPSGPPNPYPRPSMASPGPRPYTPGTPPLLPPRAALPTPPPPPPPPMWPAVPRYLLVAFKEQQTEKYLIPLGMNTYMSRVGGDYVTGPPPPAPTIPQRPNGLWPMPSASDPIASPAPGAIGAGGTATGQQALTEAGVVPPAGATGTPTASSQPRVASELASTAAIPAAPTMTAPVDPQPSASASAIGGRGRTRAALGRQAKESAPASPMPSKVQPPVPVKMEADKALPPKQETPAVQPKGKPERPVSTLPTLPGETPRPGTVLISMMVPVSGCLKPDWKEVEMGLPWSNEALMKPRPPKPAPSAEPPKPADSAEAARTGSEFPAVVAQKPTTPALRKKRSTVSTKETPARSTEASEQPVPKENRLPHVYNLSAQDFTPKDEVAMQAVTIRLEGVDDALWRKIKAVADESRSEEIRVMLEEETELVAELRAREPASIKGPNEHLVAPNSVAGVPPKPEAVTEEASKAPAASQTAETAKDGNIPGGPNSTATPATPTDAVPSATAVSTLQSASTGQWSLSPAPGPPSAPAPVTPVPPSTAMPDTPRSIDVLPSTAAAPPSTARPEMPRPLGDTPNAPATSAAQPSQGSSPSNSPLQTPVRNALPVRPPFRPLPSPAELRLLNKIYDERKRDRFARLLKRVKPRSFLRFRVPQVDPVIRDALSDKWAPRPYPITTKPLYNPAEEDSTMDQPEMPDFEFLEPSKGKKRKKDEQEEVFAYEMPVSLDALDELVEEGAARLTGGRRGRGRGGGMRGGRSARANDGPSVEIDENGNVRRRYGKRSKPGAVCEGCAGQGLRVWRRGPGGKGTLCNACGDKFLAGTLGELKAPGVNGPAEDAKDAADDNSDGEKDAEEEPGDGKERRVAPEDSLEVKKEAIAAEAAGAASPAKAQEPASDATESVVVPEPQLGADPGAATAMAPVPEESTSSESIKQAQPAEPSGATGSADQSREEQGLAAEAAEQPVAEHMDVD